MEKISVGFYERFMDMKRENQSSCGIEQNRFVGYNWFVKIDCKVLNIEKGKKGLL